MGQLQSRRQWEVCPSRWCISYHQLMELENDASAHFGSDYESKSMRDVVKEIIEPCCRQHATSYALHKNEGGLEAGAYVSHAWDEPFASFVNSIRLVFGASMTKPNLWICAFALVQGDARLLAQQIGGKNVPLDQSPFVVALSKAKHFVVVRNAVTDLYSRIWCVCELYYAKKFGKVPNETYVTGSDAHADSTSSCVDAGSFDPQDKWKILRELVNDNGISQDELDELVRWFRNQRMPAVRLRSCYDHFYPYTRTDTMRLGDERVRDVMTKYEVCEVTCGEKFEGQTATLDDVLVRFRRAWLPGFLKELKESRNARFFQETDDGENATKGTLAVYQPLEKNPADSWEVTSLFELSMKATRDYRMAIFFVSSDRTIGWWCSKSPEYLAVCYVRGIETRVKGVRGYGRITIRFEPDAMFTGYLEMTNGGDIECRLGHASQLYAFGSDAKKPTIALLFSSLGASLVAVGVMLVGRLESEDSSSRLLTLAGILAMQGRDYWPGLSMSLRTCALGAAGGVTGILEAKRWNDMHRFISRNELALAIALTYLVKGKDGWRYLVGLITIIIVPYYWKGVLQNRGGEGSYWGRILHNRKFLIADAIDQDTPFFGRRPIFTLRQDDEMDEVEHDVEDTARNRQIEPPLYPPAYTRGFNSWDIRAWAVGKTPGLPCTWRSCVASVVYAVDVILACLAEFVGLLGSGIGVFAGMNDVVSIKEGNGSELFFRLREKWIGLFSCLFSCIAGCGAFVDESVTIEQVVVVGGFLFFFGLLFASIVFECIMEVLAMSSHLCYRWRMLLADGARHAQHLKLANVSSSGAWKSMHKCRRTVRATFPRKDGYSYYDGELFNVHSGWYFPACGRVSISVPRESGYLREEEEGQERDAPQYIHFTRTRAEGLLLGPSTKKKSANACTVDHSGAVIMR